MTKLMVSKKQIVSIEEFMTNYIGKEYKGNKKLTHKVMIDFLLEKNITIPKKVSFDLVSNETIMNGTYVLVKDRHSQILVYRNPNNRNFSRLLEELNTKESLARIKEVREQIYHELKNFDVDKDDLGNQYKLQNKMIKKSF